MSKIRVLLVERLSSVLDLTHIIKRPQSDIQTDDVCSDLFSTVSGYQKKELT